MKELALLILKKAGSEFLMIVIVELLAVLKGREDNTLNKDADFIKEILAINEVKK